MVSDVAAIDYSLTVCKYCFKGIFFMEDFKFEPHEILKSFEEVGYRHIYALPFWWNNILHHCTMCYHLTQNSRDGAYKYISLGDRFPNNHSTLVFSYFVLNK